MKRYSLPVIYYVGKRKDGERVRKEFEGKASVYYDTVTEYFDLPKNESEEFVNDYNVGLYDLNQSEPCLLYTSPSPRDKRQSRMPSSA